MGNAVGVVHDAVTHRALQVPPSFFPLFFPLLFPLLFLFLSLSVIPLSLLIPSGTVWFLPLNPKPYTLNPQHLNPEP